MKEIFMSELTKPTFGFESCLLHLLFGISLGIHEPRCSHMWTMHKNTYLEMVSLKLEIKYMKHPNYLSWSLSSIDSTESN
jgi:hypothetical protein